MIDISSLNWANKDFPKEINEIKYLVSVLNDIHSQFSIIKISVDMENKQQEIFFKGLITNSKIFMNEISSFNFNQVEQCNIINISMNFGNLFDLINKIYFDENKIFNDKILILFFEFNQHLAQTIKILIEFLNFPFKDFSYFKNKKFQISKKCEKSHKEIELCILNSKTENYSKEKKNEKLIHIFSDFEEKIENFKIIKKEINHIENVVEELFRGVFFNVMKISFLYLNFCENFSKELIKYKASFSEKVLNMLTVTIESLGVSFTSDELSDYELKVYIEKYNIHSEVINNFFSNNNEDHIEILDTNSSGSNSRKNSSSSSKIEIKNLSEISENLTNFINCIPFVTNLKKKILITFSKFIQEIFRHIEALIQNFTKIQKNIYIFKPVQTSTSHSQLLNTSLATKYDFFRNNFDFFLKKNEEILSQKNNFSLICNSIEVIIKEIANEENNFVNVLLKLSKEYSHYRSALTKLLIGKEKIITQIVHNKETLMKLEEASQSLTKIEISLENFKSEEGKVNEQISELNNHYKKYLEDFVENFRKNIFYDYKQRDSIRFRELYPDVMLNILNLFERAYSGVNLKLKEEFLLKKEKSEEKNIFLKQDLTTIFGLFKEEYLKSVRGCSIYNEVLNMILSDTFVDDQKSTGNSIPSNSSSNKENLEQSFCFISKDENNAYFNVDAMSLVNLMKEEDIQALRESNQLHKTKIKVNRKSTVKTVDITQLYNIVTTCDEVLNKTFYCSYQTGLSLLIPGILFVSNKRIVFQPFINMKDILTNKKDNTGISSNSNRSSVVNCIEFLKEHLISIYEKNSFIERSIEIKTNSEEFTFLFLSLAKSESITNLKYIENVLNSIRESFKMNDINNIPESLKAENKKNELLELEQDERFSSQINLKMNSNPNIAQPQEMDEFHNTLINLNFFNRVNDFQKSQLDFFAENNLIKLKFNETFVKDKPLQIGKTIDSYIPIHLIYKYIYDSEIQCCHDDYNKAKTFILNQNEIRKDYNISFNKISQTAINIPRYYSDPFDYTRKLFSAELNSEISLKEFLDTMKENFGMVLEYEYNYTHPMKKKFMGPSKLDLNDKYKIIFLSPLCLIVEISTFISGFMLMDTFYTVAQYKYEADLYYDRNLKRIAWKTKVSASFAFEFVKDCWFRNKIESNGLVENEEYIRDFVLVHIGKVLEERSREYYNIIKKLDEDVKHEFSLLSNSTEIKKETPAAVLAENEENIFAKEKNWIEPNQCEESKLKSGDNLLAGSKDTTLEINKLLTRNNLLMVFITFSVIFITTAIFSSVFPGFNQLKELLLCLMISFNTVFLYKLSEKVSDLQKKINSIEIGSKTRDELRRES